MIGPMQVWASGNFLLFQSTFQTLVQYCNSTAIVWNFSWYWQLPQKLRLVIFLLAVAQVTAWFAAVVSEIARAWIYGDTPLNTN